MSTYFKGLILLTFKDFLLWIVYIVIKGRVNKYKGQSLSRTIYDYRRHQSSSTDIHRPI